MLLPALVRSWRDLPDWSRWLLVGGVVYTLAQGRLAEFQGGDGFYGYRHGLEFLACAAPAFALSAVRMGRVAQALVGPLLALQFAAISVGAMSDGFFVLRADAWVDNSYWLAPRPPRPATPLDRVRATAPATGHRSPPTASRSGSVLDGVVAGEVEVPELRRAGASG